MQNSQNIKQGNRLYRRRVSHGPQQFAYYAYASERGASTERCI